MNRAAIFLVFFFQPFLTSASGKDTLFRNVRVSFYYQVSNFPTEWQKSPINALGGSLEQGEIERSRKVTFTALSKYPSSLLRLNLKAVFWLRKMSFYSVGYGGTNSTDAVYLTNDGASLGYSDNYLEQTFHHEFSSILYRNYSSLFDTSAWIAANERDFVYNDPEEGVGAIRNNTSSQDLDTFYCRKGMLTEYAMSSIENDLNTFAQNIFSPSPGFWLIVDSFPRVRKKLGILISFYSRINPVFTEQYFRKLAQ